jgi:hypothetical protein
MKSIILFLLVLYIFHKKSDSVAAAFSMSPNSELDK